MPGKKRPILQAAAALADVANKEGVYVFSSEGDEILEQENASAVISKLPFTQVHCADCTTAFHAPSELSAPYCVLCGSDHVSKVDTASDKEEIAFPSDEQCVYVTCGSCKVNHTIQRSVLSAVGGVIHCTVCGAEVDSEGVDDEDELPITSAEDDDMEMVDLLGDEETEQAESIDKGDPENEEVPEPNETAESIDKGDPENEEVLEPNETAKTQVAVNLMETTSDTVESNLIDLGTSLVLIQNDRVVASMKEVTAGENKDLWGTEGFQIAIATHLKQHGLKKTVEAFNFTPATVTAPISKVIADKITSGVQEKTATLNKTEQQLADTLKQSLEIAAVGLNKDFWKGVSNPLKAALIQELSQVGIQKPERLVSRVFDKHGVAYAATLLAQAQALSAKSVETRNELSSTLDMCNSALPTITAGEAVDDGDDDEDDYGDDETATIRPVSIEKAHAALLGGGMKRSSHQGNSEIATLLKSSGISDSLFSS